MISPDADAAEVFPENEGAPPPALEMRSAGMARWSLARRFSFRFAFVYLVLYLLPFPLNIIPGIDVPVQTAYEAVWGFVVPEVADSVFGTEATLTANGSGDTTFDYVQVFTYFVLALAAAGIWSFLDRRRAHYARLWEWLRVYVRFALAVYLIGYGAVKVIPTQFSPPTLDRLVQPFGDASPMGILWTFMGASMAYTIFAGVSEMLGGLLLISRRTATLGAIVGAGVLTNVVALNFCYDVPVKLLSSHLLAMAVFLILPDLGRLTNLLVLNRRVEPAPIEPLFRRPWLHRSALGLRTIFLVGYAGFALYQSWGVLHEYGALSPEPPLYGIWKVDEFVADGSPRPPRLTDDLRWRRLIFSRPGLAVIQAMDGSRTRYGLDLSPEKKTLTLAKRDDPKWRSGLTYRQPGPKLLTVEGTFDGHEIQARLSLEEPKFLLTTRGFHWINEFPFNR